MPSSVEVGVLSPRGPLLEKFKVVHRFCDLFFELAMQISGQTTWKAANAPCWQDEAEFGKWLPEYARGCGA